MPVSLWNVVLIPDATEGALAPWLAPAADGLMMTWLEPTEAGYRLRFSHYAGRYWSEPVTIAEGTGFFANWADVPSVAEAPDGTLLAHWLEMTGEGTYAYGIRLARSLDRGVTWQSLGFLHDDGTPTEHGFVSMVPEGGGGFRAFWLDGRETLDGGPMTLRTRILGERLGPSSVLDDRVCDCCPTAAAVTVGDGLLVAYRDRTEDEVRDIYVRRLRDGAWSAPTPLHRDGWVFPACPVNGPALAADGDRVAAAWFTAEGDVPRVLAAFSDDGGASFSEPVEVDHGEGVLGRVGVALAPAEVEGGGAAVSWLATGDHAAILLRRVTAEGRVGEPWELARTSAARASGIPRLVARSGFLYVAWLWKASPEATTHLDFRAVEWDELPVP